MDDLKKAIKIRRAVISHIIKAGYTVKNSSVYQGKRHEATLVFYPRSTDEINENFLYSFLVIKAHTGTSYDRMNKIEKEIKLSSMDVLAEVYPESPTTVHVVRDFADSDHGKNLLEQMVAEKSRIPRIDRKTMEILHFLNQTICESETPLAFKELSEIAVRRCPDFIPEKLIHYLYKLKMDRKIRSIVSAGAQMYIPANQHYSGKETDNVYLRFKYLEEMLAEELTAKEAVEKLFQKGQTVSRHKALEYLFVLKRQELAGARVENGEIYFKRE